MCDLVVCGEGGDAGLDPVNGGNRDPGLRAAVVIAHDGEAVHPLGEKQHHLGTHTGDTRSDCETP